jgi:hypothetical protein
MNNEYAVRLIGRYSRFGILVDTNLLVLYFVGNYAPDRIGSKRLQTFAHSDLEILQIVLAKFDKLITTPHILSEVSNFIEQITPERWIPGAFAHFASGIDLMEERSTPIQSIYNTEAFLNHGVADAGIVSLAQTPYLILTDDLPLASRLESMGSGVLNFNHLRASYEG